MPNIRSGSASSRRPGRRAKSSNGSNRETLKALQAPKVREKLAGLGVDPMPMSPAEFAAHVEREVALNAALVQKAGLKAE